MKKKTSTGMSFIKTGIPGFDGLLGQGIPHGASVLVEGGPGSGKTILSMQICQHACKNGLKALYMSFEEPEHNLRDHMMEFGWDPTKYEKDGKLMIKRFNALDIARSVEALLSEAKRELLIDIQPVLIPKEFNPDVVCIDSLSSISSAFSGEESRFRIYMEQLFRYLESHSITTFLIREVANPTHVGGTYNERGEAVSFLSDGIIVLYNVVYPDGKRDRAVEILKMRGANIDRRIVRAEIKNGKGFVVYPTQILKRGFKLT
jgi:KaiC/GvpD/RAD55 family RecA-like ATPase